MFSLQSLFSANLFSISPRNSSLRKIISTVTAYSNPNASFSDDLHAAFFGHLSNYSSVTIEGSVELNSEKLRLDSWISSRISGICRTRVRSSIRSGLVSVNSQVINKVTHVLRDGDVVNCKIELQTFRAEPEDIPLNIVYRHEHVLVVNKPAHMVVHPAPDNATRTHVNENFHHCRLSTVCFSPEALTETDDSGDEVCAFPVHEGRNENNDFGLCEESVRLEIVHRPDKGTSGLLVVAKDEHSHTDLAERFKKYTLKRVYIASPGLVESRLGDPSERHESCLTPHDSSEWELETTLYSTI
ncbi:RNA pseudouridine synthase 2- chloroplastic [Striga hermonthica]|uniref:RNA pseudouridine synthase 2- chloroplastic n=1 Tax=Striga hermonthica TaxID=68872 RepID=A0A9N7MNU4_STRHE|nr:RNA pseudouridine synthase 2- chloroplastic [Striga hermonthica]